MSERVSVHVCVWVWGGVWTLTDSVRTRSSISRVGTKHWGLRLLYESENCVKCIKSLIYYQTVILPGPHLLSTILYQMHCLVLVVNAFQCKSCVEHSIFMYVAIICCRAHQISLSMSKSFYSKSVGQAAEREWVNQCGLWVYDQHSVDWLVAR